MRSNNTGDYSPLWQKLPIMMIIQQSTVTFLLCFSLPVANALSEYQYLSMILKHSMMPTRTKLGLSQCSKWYHHREIIVSYTQEEPASIIHWSRMKNVYQWIRGPELEGPTMTVVVGTEEFRKPINVYRDLTRCFSATRQSSGHSVYVE